MTRQKNTNQTEHSLIVAVDWASEKHDLLLKRNNSYEMLTVPNSAHRLHELFHQLYKENDSKPFPVIYEKERHFLHSALKSLRDILILYPQHPLVIADYRGTRHSSRSKSDAIDCRVLMEYFTRHEDLLMPEPETKKENLDRLCRDRRDFVNEKTKLIQKAKALLSSYFPDWTSLVNKNLNSKVTLEFLKRYSTPQAVIAASEKELCSFYQEFKCRKFKLTDRLSSRLQLKATISCPFELKLKTFKLAGFLDQIQALMATIESYDREIEQQFAKSNYHKIITSFPGAGPQCGPRVASFVEKNLPHTASLAQFMKLSAIAPIQDSSGKKNLVKRRYLCDRFNQQTFVEWAGQTLKSEGWQNEFYKGKRKYGMGRNQALRALAFKWLRILYACLQSGKEYNPDSHTKNRAKRNQNAA